MKVERSPNFATGIRRSVPSRVLAYSAYTDAESALVHSLDFYM